VEPPSLSSDQMILGGFEHLAIKICTPLHLHGVALLCSLWHWVFSMVSPVLHSPDQAVAPVFQEPHGAGPVSRRERHWATQGRRLAKAGAGFYNPVGLGYRREVSLHIWLSLFYIELTRCRKQAEVSLLCAFGGMWTLATEAFASVAAALGLLYLF
jgi:hypothetical protein